MRATITDAFVVMGFMARRTWATAPSRSTRKARAAVADIAKGIGRSVEEAAEAVVRIAVSGMYMEVSKLISRSGVDPRAFALQAFGGAGPMMGCFLAAELDMTHVVVPTAPGVLSALGGLIADIKNDFIKTVYLDLEPEAIETIQAGYEDLRRRRSGGCAKIAMLESRALFIRRTCAIAGSPTRSRPNDAREIAEGGIGRWPRPSIGAPVHLRACDRGAPVQVINLRMVIVGASPKPEFPKRTPVGGTAKPTPEIEVISMAGTPRYRSIYVSSWRPIRPSKALRWWRRRTTTCITAGFSGSVDAYGHLILKLAR